MNQALVSDVVSEVMRRLQRKPGGAPPLGEGSAAAVIRTPHQGSDVSVGQYGGLFFHRRMRDRRNRIATEAGQALTG